MDREIARFYCLKELRYKLPQNPKVHAALNRLIILEKTFGSAREMFQKLDPVIPEFTYEPAVKQFKKDIYELKIAGFSDSVETVDKSVEIIKNIVAKFFMKKKVKEEGKLKVYPDEAGKNLIFEYTPSSKPSMRGGRGGRGRGGPARSKPVKIFQKEIPKEICEFLREKVESDVDFKVAIFKMWIRYINLSNWDDMYQLRISSGLHKILQNDLDVKLELCASPINSQFKFFGSLFYDTDSAFGSMGNYIDIIKNPCLSGMIEINPPYIEMIQADIVQKMLAEMTKEDRELGCILYLANWPDNDSYKSVIDHKYLRKSFLPGKITESEEKAIFNLYSEQDNKFYNVAKKTCMFILMNNKIWNKYSSKLNKIFTFRT